MSLIKVGSINDFSVTAKPEILLERANLKEIRKFKELEEVSIETEPDSFELVTSTNQRGIGVKKIMLTEGFDGFLANLFDSTNEVYFVAWAWDLSGEKVIQYPGEGIDYRDVIIPMKVGKLREFIGEGINLFPKRKVKGGIAVRIQLWESDQNVRNFGKAMSDTANTIKNSELNQLLAMVSAVTGVSGATIALVKEAAIELSHVIGTILQANGDDYVDFFEGYYASDQIWNALDENYEGNSSLITLKKY